MGVAVGGNFKIRLEGLGLRMLEGFRFFFFCVCVCGCVVCWRLWDCRVKGFRVIGV